MTTVYFTIGNSDDKLPQKKWAEFINAVNAGLILTKLNGAVVYFAGTSLPDAPWQNAMWCVRLPNQEARDALRSRLRTLAHRYVQDSIAWAEVDQVDMLEPESAGGW